MFQLNRPRRHAPPLLGAAAAVLWTALFLPACSFDATGLTARACSEDAECPGEQRCILGYCQGEPGVVVDASSDTQPGLDGGDPIPEDIAEDGGPPPDGGLELDVAEGDIATPDVDPDIDADAGPRDAGSCDPAPVCDGGRVVRCDPATGDEVVVQDCEDPGSCNAVLGCVCDEGACQRRVCAPGSARCGEGGEPQVCQVDGLAFLAGTPCGDEELCIGGRCMVTACEPGRSTCDEGARVVCSPDGTIDEVEACLLARAFCADTDDGAVCLPWVCEPGTIRCEGGAAVRERIQCSMDGSLASMAAPCEEGTLCSEGRCIPETCAAGSRSCLDGSTLAVCNATGTSLQVTPCTANQFCSAADGSCRPRVCEPAGRRCTSDGVPERCNTLGSAWVALASCDASEQCDRGECIRRICEPGQTVCITGTESGVCNATGTGYSARQPCGFRCAEGVCRESICGDGIVDEARGERCDDGNAVGCDACSQCQQRSFLRLSETSETLSDVRWLPRQSDFTMELWIRTAAATTVVMGIGNTNDLDQARLSIIDGLPVFTYRLDRNQDVRAVGTVPVNTGAWVHVAAVRVGEQGARLFVNGSLVGVARPEHSARSIDDGTGRLWVGSEGRVQPQPMDIDDVRISSVARYASPFLAPLEAAADANTIVLWRFDEGTGGSAADAAGSRNLTLRNVAWAPQDCRGSLDGFACGDGVQAPWEGCDDGNAVPGDGCNAQCRPEGRCGVGVERPGASEGGCYLLVAQPLSWTDARRSCQLLPNGNLVTINDATENGWLSANFPKPFWIGFSNRGTTLGNGPFSWTAGSSSYTNWASGEPNNGGAFGREDCAEFLPSGQWNDASCNSDRVAVCEYPF
jgi:cysteine-rich repeat protein